MDRLDAMAAFVKVVALGSYAEAARALGLTRSAISKAVAELEEHLGARLLDRTTRRVSPTEAGIAYHERCLDILARIEDTELQITSLHEEPRGLLKVNGPMSFGTLYLAGAVADFMARYPDLKVELTLTDRFIDPLEEGVDVTVRIGAMVDSSLVARRLAPAERVIVASPAYLARTGVPQTPLDLGRHRALCYGHTGAVHRWELPDGDGATVQVPLAAALCSNNGEVLRAAALAGNGIAVLPTFIVGDDIAAGRLALVLPDHRLTDLSIHVLYAPNRYLAAKTRAFIDFLVGRFAGTAPWARLATPPGR